MPSILEPVQSIDAPKPPAKPEEPDLEAEWKAWSADRSPAANSRILTAMAPTIRRAASAQVGDLNPLNLSRARKLALTAVTSYSPTKGKLESHLYNHMRGLRRYAAQASNPLPMPERAVLDRKTLDTAHAELADRLGRDPNIDELADATGFSPRRIAKVRSVRTPMTHGYFESMGETGDEGSSFTPAVRTDRSAAYARMVYDDLDPIDKKIMEHTMGIAGARMLQNQQIARKLGLSPAAISTRKQRIQALLDQASTFNI